MVGRPFFDKECDVNDIRKSTAPSEIFSVPCERVRKFNKQPRTYFDPARLKDLQESIRELGQLAPVLVRRIEGTSNFDFELVSGERRWRACAELGIQLRVTVVEVSGALEQFALAVASNAGEPLTPMEVSRALHELRKLPELRAVAKEDQLKVIARLYFNRGHKWAWEHWGLVRLDGQLQRLIEPDTKPDERMPLKIAASVASLPPDRQVDAWCHIRDENMTTACAQAYITNFKREEKLVVRGRHSPDGYLKFSRFTERTVRELVPFLDMLASDEFRALSAQRDRRINEVLAGDVQGIIERLSSIRDVLLKARRSQVA